MRFSPATTTSLLIAVFLAAGLQGPLWMGLSPSSGAEGGEHLEDIESHLQKERQKLEGINLREKDLLGELTGLQQRIREDETALRHLDEELKAVEDSVEELKTELERSEESLSDITSRLERRLAVLYKFAREGYLRVVVASEGMIDLLHQIKYMKSIVKEDAGRLEEMVEKSSACRHQIARLGAALAETGRRRLQVRQQAEAMRRELDGRVLELMRLHEEKKFYETAVRELAQAASMLKEKLAVKESVSRPGSDQTFADFEAAKGHLPPPLTGDLVRLGDTSAKGSVAGRKGVFIRSQGVREVKAVFEGRVDFSGSLKGYGDMIILNHGNRFFTVMAQLSERKLKKGEWARRGDVVGRVADGGPLYFEIREGTEILDPIEWLGQP